jgi:hypothetical protein
LYLCQHESVHLVVDALLRVDPRTEFTKSELVEFAGIRLGAFGDTSTHWSNSA